jgi:hypothetical protein
LESFAFERSPDWGSIVHIGIGPDPIGGTFLG